MIRFLPPDTHRGCACGHPFRTAVFGSVALFEIARQLRLQAAHTDFYIFLYTVKLWIEAPGFYRYKWIRPPACMRGLASIRGLVSIRSFTLFGFYTWYTAFKSSLIPDSFSASTRQFGNFCLSNSTINSCNKTNSPTAKYVLRFQWLQLGGFAPNRTFALPLRGPSGVFGPVDQLL